MQKNQMFPFCYRIKAKGTLPTEHTKVMTPTVTPITASIHAEIDTRGGVYPDIEIMKSTRQNDVDLMVTGSHTKIKGRLEETRWHVGSAAERVSARSDRPAVVITDPNRSRV